MKEVTMDFFEDEWLYVKKVEEKVTTLFITIQSWRKGDILIRQEGLGDFKVYWAPGEECDYRGQTRRFNDAVKMANKLEKLMTKKEK